MMRYVLAVDNGSQSTKVSIVDERGRVHAQAQRPLQPSVHPAVGHVVHPGDDVWDSIKVACREALSRFPGDLRDIGAVGLCTIRFCRAVLTGDGSLAEPLLSWMDERVSLPFSGHNPAARYLTSSSGYITHRLTGNRVDTAGNYQGVWPMDHATWRWSTDQSVYAATGMPREMLFDLVDPGDLLGVVSADAAASTGLPVGLPVYATSNDKAVEALGCGLREENTVLVSLGTYIAGMAVGRELVEDSGGVFWTNFGSRPGQYLYESNGIRRGMWTVSWYRQLLADDGGTEEQLNAGAAEIPPGSGGLMTLLDWLAPDDQPRRRGAMLGFDGTQGRFHIYRSILEGISMTMHGHVDAMMSHLDRRPERLIVSGGGSKSDVMMQIFADVFDLPATRMRMSDAAGLGAAICAAVGSGIHPDWDSAVDAMVGSGKSAGRATAGGERVGGGVTFAPRARNVAAYATLSRSYAGLRKHTDPLFAYLASSSSATTR